LIRKRRMRQRRQIKRVLPEIRPYIPSQGSESPRHRKNPNEDSAYSSQWSAYSSEEESEDDIFLGAEDN